MDRRARRWIVAAGAVAVALAPAACGLEPNSGHASVTVTVTRDFGARRLASVTVPRDDSTETMAQLLEALAACPARRPTARSSRSRACRPPGGGRWFGFINGISTSLAPLQFKLTKVHPGDAGLVGPARRDRDRRRCARSWGSTRSRSRTDPRGRRLPTTLQCATDFKAACNTVSSALSADKVPIATSLLGTGSGQDSLGVVVGKVERADAPAGGAAGRARARRERYLREVHRRRRGAGAARRARKRRCGRCTPAPGWSPPPATASPSRRG